MLAFELEGEVIGQMSALVVAAQQPKRVWVPNFERPKIENALELLAHTSDYVFSFVPQY